MQKIARAFLNRRGSGRLLRLSSSHRGEPPGLKQRPRSHGAESFSAVIHRTAIIEPRFDQDLCIEKLKFLKSLPKKGLCSGYSGLDFRKTVHQGVSKCSRY